MGCYYLMRHIISKALIDKWMERIGSLRNVNGVVYITGGTTSIYKGWRDSTMDIDFNSVPEIINLTKEIANLKNELEINIEQVLPHDFIPHIDGWETRSEYIRSVNDVHFYHYDFFGQALSKILRDHGNDRLDLDMMVKYKAINIEELKKHFDSIQDNLWKYSHIDKKHFESVVLLFCKKYTIKKEKPKPKSNSFKM